MKNFCSLKETVKRVIKQAVLWKNIYIHTLMYATKAVAQSI